MAPPWRDGWLEKRPVLNRAGQQALAEAFAGFHSASGYHFDAERERYRFSDVGSGQLALNRGRDIAGITQAPGDDALAEQASAVARDVLIATTLRRSAPVVHVDLPMAGHYLRTPEGVVFDAYLGVAQRLLDLHHPRYQEMVSAMTANGTLLRREAATNDLLVVDGEPTAAVTPQALAAQLTTLAAKAFPGRGGFRAYLCSSGTEAIEAAIKLAFLRAHRRILERFGAVGESRLMDEFAIPRLALEHPQDREKLYADYPFFVISAKGGFHGRTLGSLSLSTVRPVNRRGFPAIGRVAQISFNGDPAELESLIDTRTLDAILSQPGGVAAEIGRGRIPRDLIAGVLIEVFQGEAGYRLGEPGWIKAIGDACKALDVPLLVDEIQTFARTGEVFATQHYGLEPDIVAVSKASVVGAMLASSAFADLAPLGWHSSTWGGGKLFDNTYAWTTIDTYLKYEDPIFEGASYLENQRLKAEYIRVVFDWLAERHPRVLRDARGLGGMWGFTVFDRDRVCAVGRRVGLKLLTCGVTEEWSSIRAVFLADALTKEIDCFGRLLDYTLSIVEHGESSVVGAG